MASVPSIAAVVIAMNGKFSWAQFKKSHATNNGDKLMIYKNKLEMERDAHAKYVHQ